MRKPKAPEANRARILDAAIEEFAARGFKGASMDAIRRIVEFTYNYYLEHQGFVRLVVAENQAGGRRLRKSRAMRSLNRSIIDTLQRVLQRGQQDGTFRPDLDAVEIHKAIAALGMFNVTNQHTFSAIFRREMGTRGDVAGRRAMVTDMILQYVANRS